MKWNAISEWLKNFGGPITTVIVILGAFLAGVEYVVRSEVADIRSDVGSVKSEVSELKTASSKTNDRIDDVLKEALERAFPVSSPTEKKAELEEGFKRAKDLMRFASSESISLNPELIENYGRQVAALSKEPSVSGAVWPAAAELINYRSSYTAGVEIPPDIASRIGPPIQNLGNCLGRPMSYWKAAPHMQYPDGSTIASRIILHDCTLYLDDVRGFDDSRIVSDVKSRIVSGKVDTPFFLTLVRVKIVYKGGPIIPVAEILALGCSFDFDVPAAPPPRGKDLLEAILSENLDSSKLDLKIPL
jgi:hypothetical protein